MCKKDKTILPFADICVLLLREHINFMSEHIDFNRKIIDNTEPYLTLANKNKLANKINDYHLNTFVPKLSNLKEQAESIVGTAKEFMSPEVLTHMGVKVN